MARTGGNVMRLKYKEKLNELITNKVDLGEIVYTSEKIIDSNIETNLHDVYARASVYKENAFYDIESDCKAVHGYGLHVTSHNVNFFSTCFYVRLDGVLYAIVDTPSRRIAYTNDSRFDFSSIKARVYGCRYKCVRDEIRAIVKPYLKAMNIINARVDYTGYDYKSNGNYEFAINGVKFNEKQLNNFNQDYYRTYINLNTMKGSK